MAPEKYDPDVETKLTQLQFMSVAKLRSLWRSTFKSNPPNAFGPDLLRRTISQSMQERAYGELAIGTVRALNQLISQGSKANAKIVMPRRIQTGAILVREWKGKSHRVTVLKEGFAYEGKPHESLSKVARLITGTRWNGPRFFGLRADREQR